MLQSLRIKNLALLDSVDLDFKPGFTIVTGETGAGKSIFLGALGLLTGSRADKSMIRHGQTTCEVEAILYFKNPVAINLALRSLNLPLCYDGTLIIKRILSENKSQKILINDTFSSLPSLQKIADLWIDFHGPGEPQKLFNEKYQLTVLDAFGKTQSSLTNYQTLFHKWKNITQQIQTLQQTEELSSEEIAFYQSQIIKINQVNPDPDSIAALEESFSRFTHSQEINELSTKIQSSFSEQGALGHLRSIIKPLQRLLQLIPNNAHYQLLERVHNSIIEIEDINSELSGLAQSEWLDEQDIVLLQEKMNLWLEIKRKYGPTLQAVIEKRNNFIQLLNSQSNIEKCIYELTHVAQKKEQQLKILANELQTSRQKVAMALSIQILQLLKKIGLPKAKFEVAFNKEFSFKEFGEYSCSFLFSANPGHPLLPLNKIASSGELARVMLALKTLLAEVDNTPLLVFDEIDANIGGEIASQVAKELVKLSKNHQVFCITHLPQVAAYAHSHLLVEKHQDKQTTSVSILTLNTQSMRIEELARMLGDRHSSSARSHAKELLSMA